VTGVHVSSLPPNAISYYEAEDVSVVFEIPMGQVHTTRVVHTQYWPGHHAPPCAGRPRPLICAGARTHTRQGRIIYLGYDYSEPVTPWVHALVAASMFNDYDFKGPPPVTASSSVK